jgi:hypothetical protein
MKKPRFGEAIAGMIAVAMDLPTMTPAEADAQLKIRATAKDRKLLALFGVTEAEDVRVREHQQDRCYICGKDLQLNHDHDHRSGEYRGLLCFLHNKGLALFQDDPILLERAAYYLRNHPVETAIGEKRFGRPGRVTRKWRTKREKRERMAWVEARLRELGYEFKRKKKNG